MEPWVERLNAVGENLGADGGPMISLDDDELIHAAVANTGLSDFGDDWWREPFRVLLGSLRDEAELTFVGRILARAEMQRLLQQRLRLMDVWRTDPGLRSNPIERPIFVTGLGRSGTTWLHELLAADPANRSLRLWEAMYPTPPPLEADGDSDPRIMAADREITIMDAMVPAFTTMHENRGNLPTECIFVFAHQFVTDMFLGQYNCPSFAIWQSGIDSAPLYSFHRAVLSTLQSGFARDRWVLKAPSHLGRMPTLFAEYQDARVVICHRDPLKVVGSLANLMATLQSMRTRHVDYDAIIPLIAYGTSMQLDGIISARADGRLPDGQITDVIYTDLVDDPIRVVEDLYRGWDLEVTEDFRRALETLANSRTRHHHGAHEYRFEDTGLDLADERSRVASYQAHYGVPSEVG